MMLARFSRFSRAAVAAVVVVSSAASAFAVTACGDGGGAKSANVKSGPMPENEAWNGVYFHPVYGYLHLIEEGNNVVGRWKRADQSHWGELSGTVTGNVVHFTWKEHKIGMIGASATTHGKGYFAYKLDPEGHAVLDGEYGLNDEEIGADWHNVKQARMQPDLKSIGGDAEGAPPGGF
ncbi:hypothetical protein [Labilithrix luteola]|nr:hypothetical protein [Labilithrix luteola]